MPWIELHATTSAEFANDLSDQLTEHGALAVTFQDAGDQPIYEPSPETPRLWHETVVIGLFDDDHPLKEIIAYLEDQQALGFLKNFHIKPIADEDWERRCLDSFKPIQFGQRLWICPSWHTPPEPNAVNVILDPGLAFGTGTHPTTALCLEWLDKNIIGNEEVIDYGCGSGILAIAALKLGAKRVIAIDNDPQALQATRANAERNHIDSTRIITQTPESLVVKPVNILMANILASPLIHLAPQLADLTEKNGKIVLSGILKEQVDDIICAFSPWFVVQSPTYREKWTRVEGIRK
jgi:ribosomal protein L11 methyltransferase